MSEEGKLNFLKYRHLLIAIFIIIMVIILNIIFENYASKVIEKVNGNVKKIDKILQEDQNTFKISDIKKMEKLIEKTIKHWEKKSGILTCFIEHDEIEKINAKLHLLEIELKNNLWGDAKRTISETEELVKFLNGKYTLSLQNIF